MTSTTPTLPACNAKDGFIPVHQYTRSEKQGGIFYPGLFGLFVVLTVGVFGISFIKGFKPVIFAAAIVCGVLTGVFGWWFVFKKISTRDCRDSNITSTAYGTSTPGHNNTSTTGQSSTTGTPSPA